VAAFSEEKAGAISIMLDNNGKWFVRFLWNGSVAKQKEVSNGGSRQAIISRNAASSLKENKMAIMLRSRECNLLP
jgi:hypothetical protein